MLRVDRRVHNLVRITARGRAAMCGLRHATSNGERFWKLNNYLVEGERVRTWFVDGVVKQHRTVATYVNAVAGAGLQIDRLVEWPDRR